MRGCGESGGCVLVSAGCDEPHNALFSTWLIVVFEFELRGAFGDMVYTVVTGVGLTCS